MSKKVSNSESININYSILAERLKRGEIIPFIGSEIRLLSNLPENPSEIALLSAIQQMAQKARYDNFIGTFPMICQYYLMEYGRPTMLRQVKELAEPECSIAQTNPLYHLLSQIPSPLLILSSSYDDGLEAAFKAKNKKFALISHHVQPGAECGKILVKYSDKEERELCTPDELSGTVKPFESGYSVIYKICGCFSLCDSNEIDNIDPLMISEEDFFYFLRQLERVMPAYLVNRVKKRSLLFLGYNLNEWHDRLIATAILEKKQGTRERSYAVHNFPNLYERSFWKNFNVDIHEIGLWKFIEDLTKIMPDIKM